MDELSFQMEILKVNFWKASKWNNHPPCYSMLLIKRKQERKEERKVRMKRGREEETQPPQTAGLSSHLLQMSQEPGRNQKWHSECMLCESPLDCKEIQPVHPKGNQHWIFIGRTDAEAEAPIFWSPDAKNWLIGKDPDAGKDGRQEEKGTTEDEMVGWHHRFSGQELE